MLTPIAITFLVNVATQVAKKFVIPRFGEFGVHVVAFVFCLVASLIFFFKGQFPQIEQLLFVAAQVFCLAVTFYEVVLKRLTTVFTN